MQITLYVKSQQGDITVMMPSATTGLYAAKRVAEALGLSDDVYWQLMTGPRWNEQQIADDAIITDYDRKTVWLTVGG